MQRDRSLTFTVGAAAAILSAALGVRQTFGVFVVPIAREHAVNLTQLSLALAVQNLMWGLAQPAAGAFADRYGPGRVIALGAVLYAAGMLAVALAPALWPIVLGFGVLVGLGQAAMTFGTALAVVSRRAPAARRNSAVALAAAGGSIGQIALVPIAQFVIGTAGVRVALLVLCCAVLAVVPLALLLRAPHAAEPPVRATAAIRDALRDGNFLLLTAGFFACGFQLAFLGVHLPGYVAACGLSASVGATALALIGGFNIIGSYAFGRAADAIEPQRVLSVLYAIRASATVVYLALPVSAATTLTFSVVMGLTWLGTVPLTNAVVARRFGLANLGTLFGVCFLGHQAGSFLGALAGGLSLQLTSSYTPAWVLTIAVGYAAVLLNVPIRSPRAAAAT